MEVVDYGDGLHLGDDCRPSSGRGLDRAGIRLGLDQRHRLHLRHPGGRLGRRPVGHDHGGCRSSCHSLLLLLLLHRQLLLVRRRDDGVEVFQVCFEVRLLLELFAAHFALVHDEVALAVAAGQVAAQRSLPPHQVGATVLCGGL